MMAGGAEVKFDEEMGQQADSPPVARMEVKTASEMTGSASLRHQQTPRMLKVALSIMCVVAYYQFGTLVSILGPSVSDLASILRSRPTQFSSAFTAQGLGDMLGSLLFSRFEKRLPPKPMMTAISILCAGLSTVAAAFCPTLSWFVAATFVQGVFMGSTDVTANSAMLDLWGPSASPWMQGLHAAFGVGSVSSPSIVGVIGAKQAYVIFGSLTVLPLILLLPTTRRRAAGEPQRAAGEKEGEGEGEEDRGRRGVPWPVEVLLYVSFFTYVAAEVGFGGWLATVLLAEKRTDSRAQAAFSVSVFWGAITIGRLVSVPLSTLLPARLLLQAQLATAMVAAVLYATIGRQSLTGTQATAAIYGLGLGPQFPLLMSLPDELGLHPGMQTLGRFVVASNLGEALGPLALGHALGRLGPHPTYGLYSVACMCIMVTSFAGVLAIVRRRRRGQGKGCSKKEDDGEGGGGGAAASLGGGGTALGR